MRNPRTSSVRKLRACRNRSKASERGQAAVFLVLAMGIFLIGGIGFVVDGANLWFHRQSAQTAADAACTAGVMDMLSTAAGTPSQDWIGKSFDCSGMTDRTPNSSVPPCAYAALNGYSGSGGQKVRVSFPAPANISLISDCPNIPDPSNPVCKADDVALIPYMQVSITDNIANTFMRLVGSGPTTAVPARAQCGLSNVLSAVPILVLNPNGPNQPVSSVMTADAGSSLTVLNGPQKSIQVNSVDIDDAVSLSSAEIDLSEANGGNGGSFSVASREPKSSAGGSITGKWVNAAGVFSDPFAATIDAPQKPTQDCSAACIAYGTQPGTAADCPPTASCDIYTPGYYPNGISVQRGGGLTGKATGKASGVAVFEPGIYYLDGDFVANNHSCLRPGTGATGDIGGTLFYFHGPHTLSVGSNSGELRQHQGSKIVFDCQNDAVQLSSFTCLSNLPAGVATLAGNVLLAPCTGPYGDPLGTAAQRGMLFFQDRDSVSNQATWSAAGSYGLVGSLYFHDCNSTSSSNSSSGANCSSTAFTDTLNLGTATSKFNASPAAYVIGNIVADQLHLSGALPLNVSLNPNPQYYVLKASLLQ